MRRHLCVALLAACSSSSPKPAAPTEPAAPVAEAPAPARTAAAPVVQVMTADSPASDLDGNTFIVPEGWKIETAPAMVLVSPPEGDSRLAIVNTTADSNDAARDAAWKVYKPDLRWPLLAANDTPDRDGWTRGKSYAYQTSPNEKRTVAASTRFANGRWTVVIFDFADATAEKRGGQLAKVFSHFYPKGYSRESFGGKTAAKLDAARLEQLKKFVRDAEEATGVPGVSFGVIQDGKTVWAGGIGVRELGKNETVDDKTLFMIASNTKTLTTLMLAKLVDAKKIAWDEQVTSILPSFRLGSD